MSVSVSFAGHAFRPQPCGALFWPARRALLVADLHFEKASWFARLGQFLPPYDSEATLDRLSACVEATEPTELWCLGDSFHDSAGTERLTTAARATLDRLTGALDWTWITGNHDPAVDGLGGRVAVEAEVDGILLRHEADPADPRPEISGHFHPKLKVHHRGRSVTRRCFVQSATKLILPAYGSLAGGLDVGDPALVRAVGRPATAVVTSGGRVLSFPLAA
jgi:hypothetical protein